MELKPDRMHGERIWRGVEDGQQTPLIVFQPRGIVASHGPVKDLDELTALAMAQLIRVAEDTASPEIKAQAKTFERKLDKAVRFWLKRAVLNERERCRLALVRHGFAMAEHAIFDGVSK